MDRRQFCEQVTSRPLFLDGATGTELIKRGLPAGAPPEKWVMENPDVIQALHREYFDAGSDIVLACTFGANRIKMADHGLQSEIASMNAKLVAISRKITPEGKFLFGDMSPTGKLIEPTGDFSFEEAVAVYRQQAEVLLEAGVDGFMIETMLDIQETRAALLAVRELSSDIPVMCGLTYDKTGRTIGGSTPSIAIASLQSMGADAVGCNCSTGPEEMLVFLEQMLPQARVPVFIKPNAGMPKLENGVNRYDQSPDIFSQAVRRGIDLGARIVGGCCGTTPDHIRATKHLLDASPAGQVKSAPKRLAVTSPRQLVDFSPVDGMDAPLRVIGERINPTGKKAFQAELLAGDLTRVSSFAEEQANAGADLLDVNLGLGGIDEAAMLRRAILMLSPLSPLPLVIDTVNPEAMEAALRIYPGRALVNSVSGEQVRLEKTLPLAAKYGAAIIVLPVGDGFIPETAAERMALVEKIMAEAKKYGIGPEDVLVDGLAMTVSADSMAALSALETLDKCREMGLKTVLGLSNVSFGMPDRKWLNANFLAMSMARGLTGVIANPASELLMEAKYSGDALLNRHDGVTGYIGQFAGNARSASSAAGASKPSSAPKSSASLKDGSSVALSPGETAGAAILKGTISQSAKYTRDAVSSGLGAGELVSGYLVPAIMKAGELYEKGEYFLPQLMLSGEAMRLALAEIEPDLARERVESGGGSESSGRVVVATVAGDVHDIGKNLVTLMLRNHGFDVEDLGKDVPVLDVVKAVQEKKPEILGLSALMTTTLASMRETIQAVRTAGIQIKVMVGGAAVTEHFAQEIGADGYSEDAVSAVKLATRLMSEVR